MIFKLFKGSDFAPYRNLGYNCELRDEIGTVKCNLIGRKVQQLRIDHMLPPFPYYLLQCTTCPCLQFKTFCNPQLVSNVD